MKIINMKILIGLFFFSLIYDNYAQDEKTKNDSTYIVELKEFYDGKGVVFGRDVDYGVLLDDSTDQRISLTLEDVVEVENFLDSLATLYYKDDVEGKKEYDSKFRGYYRQYWGFKSCSNDKKIFLSLYNFNNLVMKEILENCWDKGLCLNTTDFFYRNSQFFWVNLTKRKILGRTFYPLKLE